MKIRLLYLLAFLAIQPTLLAQEELEVLEALPIDESLDQTSIEDDRFIYELEELQGMRMDINKATESDLRKLPFLSPIQIQDILHYRSQFGDFVSRYELQAVGSLDSASVRYLDYIFSFDGEEVAESRGRAFSYWYYPMPKNAALRDGKFLGSGFKNSNRIRYSSSRLAYGLCAEQDIGEPFRIDSQQWGFDHLVGFFQKKNPDKLLSQILVGNFTLQLGQGLSIWQRFAMNNAAGSVFIKRASEVLVPFVSVAEYNYNRGIGLTLQEGRWQANIWGSYKPMDASLKLDTNQYSYFENFNNTGLHRTQSEIDRRMVLKERNIGAQFSYQNEKGLRLSGYALQLHYDRPIIPSEDYYAWYRLRGRDFMYAGMDFSYYLKSWHSFGELCALNGKQWAVNWGNILSVDRKLDIALYAMLQSDRFQSIYGNGFLQRNNTPQNQIYLGMDFYPKYKTKISVFSNFVRYQQFRYLLPDYTQEWQQGISFRTRIKRNVKIRLRYTSRLYPRYESSDDLKTIDYKNQHQFKLAISKEYSRKFQTQSNLYYSYLQSKELRTSSYGFALTQSFIYSPWFSTRFKLRLAYFHNREFLNRIYTFEPNIPYQYSLYFFNGRGYQIILNLKQKLSKKSSLYLRYLLEVQPGRTSLGSGYTQTEGPATSDFSLMYQWSF